MNTRSTEMRNDLSILRKQYAFLLAQNTKMRNDLSILRKQYAFLLIEIDLIYFPDAVTSYGIVKI
ncbi:hypothetical protein SAMD00079811_74040 [Scytonema sp. HK-05]|nr:hypothetical protein SAMD00079811_74040 [Scytonema sp. HK-05]